MRERRRSTRSASFHATGIGQALSLATHTTRARKSFVFVVNVARRARACTKNTLATREFGRLDARWRHPFYATLFFSDERSRCVTPPCNALHHPSRSVTRRRHEQQTKNTGIRSGCTRKHGVKPRNGRRIPTALFQFVASARAWSPSRGARSISASKGDASASASCAART